MSEAVNIMTLVSCLWQAVRFRTLSPFLYSVPTAANLKSYRNNWAPKWHLDKSNQTVASRFLARQVSGTWARFWKGRCHLPRHGLSRWFFWDSPSALFYDLQFGTRVLIQFSKVWEQMNPKYVVITIKERTGLCLGEGMGIRVSYFWDTRHCIGKHRPFATGERNSAEQIFRHNEIRNGSCWAHEFPNAHNLIYCL